MVDDCDGGGLDGVEVCWSFGPLLGKVVCGLERLLRAMQLLDLRYFSCSRCQ